jgi:hypothetical protein
VGFVLLIIAILLVLLLVLMTVPISLAFRIDRIEEIKGHVIFRWFFGLVRFRIGIPAAIKAVTRKKRKPGGKNKKLKQGGNIRVVIALLKQSAFRERAFRFFKGFLCATQTRDLYLRLRIGLGDPADTGCLWGFLGPVAGIAANIRSAEVRIEPEFMASALEVESHGELRLIPLQFIVLATTFMMSPTALQAWRTLRRSCT